MTIRTFLTKDRFPLVQPSCLPMVKPTAYLVLNVCIAEFALYYLTKIDLSLLYTNTAIFANVPYNLTMDIIQGV